MSTLSDICYERIKTTDTEDFWYGLFGDFNLVIDRTTNFFNATKLCEDGGKIFRLWKRKPSTRDFISYLILQNNNGYTSEEDVFKVHRGGVDDDRYKLNGTYVPQELIVDIASWISQEFKLKVYNIVMDYYKSRFVRKYKNNNMRLRSKITEKNAKIREVNAKVREVNAKLKKMKRRKEFFRNETKQLGNIIKRYERLHEDIAPKTTSKRKRCLLLLIKKNAIAKRPYYVIRVQQENENLQLLRLRRKYPKMEVVYRVDYTPNAYNLFNRMKEQIEYIEVRGNHVDIVDDEYTLTDLIRDIERLNKNEFIVTNVAM